jgi:tetratricopeptide (TPR) repeat protein
MARLDDTAAVNLLRRACALSSRETWQLELDLAAALRMTGLVPEAAVLLSATIADAASRGDQRAELHARLAELEFAEDAVSHRELAEQALHVFEQTADEAGSMRAWVAIGAIERSNCRYALSAKAYERALALARRTGDERVATVVLFQLVSLLVWGPTPVDSALQRLEQQDVPQGHPLIMSPRAQLEAMRGEIETARLLHAQAAARWDELVGHEHPGLWGALFRIEKVSGDDVAAERALRRACELLEQSGERPYRSTLTGEHLAAYVGA